VVCGYANGAQGQNAFAVDGTTGKVLWQLPDKKANRTAPNITGTYDGMVYGTTANGPVVLNARTGKDVNDSPGTAPIVTDPDVGIGDSEHDGLESYLATG
jgi:outer membrane protein assembly factor BamB